ncbi:phage tail protein [Cupriavidus sp.]|uniref:phage tail protein n=1 Tax=Cupriavidus sp. TaxID=1873897 RepID=UPI0028BEFDC1|nr:phage tail protein [Cupriavidus sp.]
MSQHDMDIANQAGAAFRADLNNALQALTTKQSGSVAPAVTFPYQFWADTGTGLLKQRNAGNNAWIVMGALDLPNFGILQPGAILYLAHANAANGWLKCNGGAVSRTTYAALFAMIGTTYGTGDGSTTFNLPELRGEFIRVWDDGRGIDAGRALGSAQAQQIISHTHTTDPASNGWWCDAPGLGVINIGGATLNINRSMATGAVSAGPATGAETRPRNVALPAYIKY